MVFCPRINQKSYPFTLPELPFDKNAFMPDISKETFDYHYEKHHLTYVNNLNKLIANHPDNSFKDKNLEELILLSFRENDKQAIFNNAAQVWNHSFFWHSIKSNPSNTDLSNELLGLINLTFGSLDQLRRQLREAAISQFGSGWAWLVFDKGILKIEKTANALTPLVNGSYPLLCIDVWEHAYYIDFRNNRAGFVDLLVDKILNWQFASENLALAKSFL